MQAGTSYAFGVYSSDLKSRLHLTQDEIQLVGAMGNVGLYLTFFSGLAFTAFGPHVASVAAVVLTLVGYLMMAGVAGGILPGSTGLLCVAAFIWSNGSSWADLVSISVQTRNFPHDRGLILGVLKSFFGLSATIFTVAYDAMFPGSASSFLLFLAIVVPSLLLVTGLTQRFVTEKHATRLTMAEVRRVHFGYGVVVAAGVYATVVTVLIKTDVIAAGEYGWFLCLLGIIAGFGCLAVPVLPCHREASQTRSSASDYTASSSATTIVSDATDRLLSDSAAGGSAVRDEESPRADGVINGGEAVSDEVSLMDHAKPATDHAPRDEVVAEGASLCEGLSSVDFWLIVLLLFAGTGSGLTLINNVGQLVPALGGTGAAVYVALLGVGNAFGRMGFGLLSDVFRRTLSRPGWLTVSVLTMALSMLLTAFADLQVLFFSVFLTGFAYGGFWSLMPAFLADRFGNKSFATLYALAMLAPAAGSILLGEKMASSIYEGNAPAGSTTCEGVNCYRLTFLILCGLCALATGVGGYLTSKLQGHYLQMLVDAGDISAEDAELEKDVAPMGSRHNLGAVLEKGGVFKDSPAETPQVAARESRKKRRSKARS